MSRTDRSSARANSKIAELEAARLRLVEIEPSLDSEEHRLSGLTSKQVLARETIGLKNAYTHETSRTLGNILQANLLTLFNGVIFGSSIFVAILGDWKDSLFVYAALFNIVIGIIQEYRAKRTLDRLALLNEPFARVRRAAESVRIHSDELVLDDLIELRVGDQVLADAVVVDSSGLELDESLLTGESEPVAKLSGDAVFTGAGVVAGTATARVTKLGPETFASKLTLEARRFSLVKSELRNALNRVVKWISWALLPVFLITANGQIQAVGGWIKAIETGAWVEAAVATLTGITTLVPQGLVLLTSIAFAVSAMKLATRKVLLQEIAAVEGLARVDVICFDKTGTLTEGDIEFDAVHLLSGEGQRSFSPDQVLAHFGADPNANATTRCLQESFAVAAELKVIDSVAFDSVKKWSAFVFSTGSKSETWMLGAPELVLSQANADHAEALALTAKLADQGRRTLILAKSDHAPGGSDSSRSLPTGIVAVAAVTFKEKIRSDAAATLEYFKAQGVEIRIISGDNPHTVAAVAAEAAGTDLGRGFDAKDLPTDLNELGRVLESNLIFGRVTPEQKRDMVLALQANGHTVAMTGDGVNDALALKRADLGIAMGSGADATKAVANLILLDGRFASLPGVVAEGRRVTANIERVSRLFLSKTVWAMLLTLSFSLLAWEFPFLPRHLTGIDIFMIGIPSFFLALLPNAQRYRPGFLGRSLAFCVPAGLGIGAAVIALNAWQRSGAWPTEVAQGATALTIAICGLWILTLLAKPFNRVKSAIVFSMYALCVLFFTLPLIADFFGFATLTPEQFAVVGFVAAAANVVITLAARLTKRVD